MCDPIWANGKRLSVPSIERTEKCVWEVAKRCSHSLQPHGTIALALCFETKEEVRRCVYCLQSIFRYVAKFERYFEGEINGYERVFMNRESREL